MHLEAMPSTHQTNKLGRNTFGYVRKVFSGMTKLKPSLFLKERKPMWILSLLILEVILVAVVAWLIIKLL